MKAEVRRLERTVAEAEASVANQIDVESELSSLESNVSMEKEIYDKLVKRLELARVTDDLGSFEAGGRVKIFAPPSGPDDVSPPANFFLLAGVIGGVALGLGLAVLAELGDTSLRRRADLERIAGLPLLGRIGRIQADHPPVSDSADAAIVMSRAPSASAYPAS